MRLNGESNFCSWKVMAALVLRAALQKLTEHCTVQPPRFYEIWKIFTAATVLPPGDGHRVYTARIVVASLTVANEKKNTANASAQHSIHELRRAQSP